MKCLYSLVFLLIIYGCSHGPDPAPAKKLLSGVSLSSSNNAMSVSADFSQVPVLKFPFADTIGLQGDSLSKEIYRKYRLNVIERFYEGSTYSFLGKIEKQKALYILYSRNSGSECTHFLVSINKNSGLMISHYQTAYEDWVEYYFNSHSFIWPDSLEMKEEFFDDGNNFYVSDLTTEKIKLSDSGHFEIISKEKTKLFYPPKNRTEESE